MPNLGAFTLAVLALLATPGPTNTLLATSGAAAGFRKSVPLIAAEISGYLLSISILALLIGPIMRSSPVLNIALRVGCGLYLATVAWQLWKDGKTALKSDQPIQFRNVFITTLLNPKAAVFAFIIIPYLSERKIVQAAPYLAEFACLVMTVAVGWIAVGSLAHMNVEHAKPTLVRRIGALAVGTFAVLISMSALKV